MLMGIYIYIYIYIYVDTLGYIAILFTVLISGGIIMIQNQNI